MVHVLTNQRRYFELRFTVLHTIPWFRNQNINIFNYLIHFDEADGEFPFVPRDKKSVCRAARKSLIMAYNTACTYSTSEDMPSSLDEEMLDGTFRMLTIDDFFFRYVEENGLSDWNPFEDEDPPSFQWLNSIAPLLMVVNVALMMWIAESLLLVRTQIHHIGFASSVRE
jgi:hypothetical protein